MYSILERINEIKTYDEFLVLDGQLLADVLGDLTGSYVEVIAEDVSTSCFKASVSFLHVCNIKVLSGQFYNNIYASHSGIMNYLIEKLHITPHYIQVPTQPTPTGNIIYKSKQSRVYPDLNNG